MQKDPVTLVVSDGIALLTLSNPPVNALSDCLRGQLLRSLSSLASRPDVSAIILTGEGHNFIAGADIAEMDIPPNKPYLPEITQMIAAMKVPVIAAIRGACLGGGLEIALACDVRLATADAILGLPETRLGLIPGAGGTQRLPRLVGLVRAIEMICGGGMIKAADAVLSGLVDAVVADPVVHGRQIASNVAKRDIATNAIVRPDDEILERLAKRFLNGRRAAEAVKDAFRLLKTSDMRSFDQGLVEERAIFLRLRESPSAQALRYLFKAERQAGKSPEAAQIDSISRIAVAGGGTMGSGIAEACLTAGYEVLVMERSQDAAASAQARIEASLQALIKRGRISPEAAAASVRCLDVTTDPALVSSCDLLIEAVFEDYATKEALFDALKPHLRASTLIASNTSYLDIDRLAQMLPYPTNFAGMHFFAPASVMKLVEVVAGQETSDNAMASIAKLARRLGKVPVIAGNVEGFIGNRIFSAYRRAMEYLVEDGASPLEIDSALEDFGFAMGPFSVFDVSGLDIAWAMRKRNATTRDPRQRYVRIADRLCEKGLFGRKSGCGWYDHSHSERTVSAAAESIIADERSLKGIVPRSIGKDEIVDVALATIFHEASTLLEEGVAQRASDIDVVLANGYGFPREKGGPMYIVQALTRPL